MKKMNEFKKRSKARAFATHTTTFFSHFLSVFFFSFLFFSHFCEGTQRTDRQRKDKKKMPFCDHQHDAHDRLGAPYKYFRTAATKKEEKIIILFFFFEKTESVTYSYKVHAHHALIRSSSTNHTRLLTWTGGGNFSLGWEKNHTHTHTHTQTSHKPSHQTRRHSKDNIGVHFLFKIPEKTRGEDRIEGCTDHQIN